MTQTSITDAKLVMPRKRNTGSLMRSPGLVALIISGVINLAMPGTRSWNGCTALGALLFLSPWLGGYALQTGVAWTSWIIGLVALVVTATAIKPSTEEHRHHGVSPSH